MYLKKFLRCVKGIDDNLGRLFAQLEASGELDNTLIVYTADQDSCLASMTIRTKRWMYGDGMPFLIRYPDLINTGQTFDTIIENVDFAPTLLDFAGVRFHSTGEIL